MKWKTVAIVFIVLFVVETVAMAGIFYLGFREINKEETCSVGCNVKDADSYIYKSGICSCYKNQEVFYSFQIK